MPLRVCDPSVQEGKGMKAIIFGANGQDGHYLCELCKVRGIEPIGVSRSGNWLRGDVSHYDQVKQLIRDYQPIYVFHVAANSTTRHDAIFENHATISTGSLNILEVVRLYSPGSKVFIAGSGVQFENRGLPISETDKFEANSAYSVSRIHSVYAARYYRSLGLRTYVGYLFHHESPFRKPHHISKMISHAVKRIAEGNNEIIELGDISVEKEWTYAGDVADAIFTLVSQDTIFEAVIGSGMVYSIRDWLGQCFGFIGKNWHDHVRIREGFVPEYHKLVSNPSTIRSLGWSPKVGFAELAHMMMKAEG
jgi:GDPmannose 4,6-dehydratase